MTAGPATPADPTPGVQRPGRTPRTWADWLGFVGFLALAVWLIAGPGELGAFLVVPVLYEVATALTFLIRGRPRQSGTGALPRVAAYGATLLVPLFVRWSVIWHPSLVAATQVRALQLAGASSVLFGIVIAFWSLWHLRGSFSVEPAARALVTSGPYQIARHPIYASYLFNYAGLVLMRPTLSMVAIYVVWLALTCLRVRYEERVLTRAFPEYTTYRSRVGAFGPRIGRRPRNGEAGIRAGIGVS